jgi:GntR family transcriptional regulator
MRIVLELESPQPLYQQIRDQIVLALATGELRDGDGLPATRQLAAEFGINFHTVNKAYDLLREEGLIRLTRKSGAVVHREPPPPAFADDWKQRARVLLAEAYVKGMSRTEIQAACESILNGFAADESGTEEWS